jgi:hypothetical protein
VAPDRWAEENLLVGHGHLWRFYLQTWEDVANPETPTWARWTMGIAGVAMAPLAGFEEYIGRSLANVPYMLYSAGTTSGQHLGRGYLWWQQDEYAEAIADFLGSFVAFARGFLEAAMIVEGMAGAGRRPKGSAPEGFNASPRKGAVAAPSAEAAVVRESVTATQLGTIASTRSRSYFRQLVTKRIQDPKHPLHFLLDPARMKLRPTSGKGIGQMAWLENPELVEAGHDMSAKGLDGARDRLVLMTAHENRWIAAVVEHNSKGGAFMAQSGAILEVEGVPVSEEALHAWTQPRGPGLPPLLSPEWLTRARVVVY